MRVTAKKRILGVATKISTKTNEPYHLVSFMEDGEPVSIMVNKNLQMPEIKEFEEYEIELDIKLGKYMNATIVAIKEVA